MSKVEIIENLSYAAYDARPGLRAGYLAALDAGTPGKAEWERTHQTDTPAMRLGRAIHCMVLEPDIFAQSYTCGGSPINPKTQKPYGIDSDKYKEWESKQKLPVISSEEHRRLIGMSEAVGAHTLARTIRDKPRKTELSIFWERDDGTKCKARIDCVQDGVIWDLKSTSNAGYRAFERSIADYRYHIQAAWFLEGAGRAGLVDPASSKFLWLAVESTPPYALAVYQAAPDLLQAGWDAAERAVELFKTCETKKDYPTAYAEQAIVMDCPGWMKPQED